jgi:hypothetical protein
MNDDERVLADKIIVYASSVANIRNDYPEDAALCTEIIERASATYERLTGHKPDLLDPALFAEVRRDDEEPQ